MEMEKKIAFIMENVRMTERMALLAEELDEMCDAAEYFRYSIRRAKSRKGRRYTMDKNFQDDMVAEMADVMAVLICISDPETLKKWLDHMECMDKTMRTGKDMKDLVGMLIFSGKSLRRWAFKHRRIGSKDNPTPYDKEFVEGIMVLSMYQVVVCMYGCMNAQQIDFFEWETEEKINRWYNRLTGGMEDEQK